MTLGVDASAAAGPVGRDAHVAVTPTAAIYTYSRSKGLFAGASLEGAVIATQKTANARYYGRPVTATAILSGHVPAPAKARVLHAALGRQIRLASGPRNDSDNLLYNAALTSARSATCG